MSKQESGVLFTDVSYRMRTELAIIHWDENVGRPAYTEKVVRGKKEKALTRPSYEYREQLLTHFSSRVIMFFIFIC